MLCVGVRNGGLVTGFALLVLATGCQGSGTVTGKVRHRAKPVVWGTVSMIASDDLQYSGQITLEGTYKIENVPNGPVKILVASPDPDPNNGGNAGANSLAAEAQARFPGPPKPPPGAWFPIPAEYSDLEQTTLKGTVRADTTIDLNLP